MRNLWFTISLLLWIPTWKEAAASEQGANFTHPPSPIVSDKFTPAAPEAVHLSGWLARYVDAVRDDFVLRQDLVNMYLMPLEERGDKFWTGEHIGKWLDAACSMWKYTGDSRIRELMDVAVSRMVAAQETNGWLGSYDEPYRFYRLNWNSLSKPSAWDTYYGWDLWCNFTSLEGLLKYHSVVTNESRALQAACRIGDLIVDTFGEGKQDIALVAHDNGAGAMTLLLAFAHLYEVTGEPRYLQFCQYILCQLGRPDTIPIILAGSRGPEADRFPYSKEGSVIKHTETELILRGLCELYRMTGDSTLLATCLNVHEAGYAPLIKTMCLSGYTSPKAGLEVPRTVRPKLELCDTPAMLRWWAEMFRLTGDVQFLNAMERQVYNQLLAHRTLSGLEFAYMAHQHFDSPSGCLRRYGSLGPFDCCWSMGPVGFGDLPCWSYFTSVDGILVNFYEPSTFSGVVNGVGLKLEQKTEYPVEGRVEIVVNPKNPVTFALKLRIPDWCGRRHASEQNDLGREREKKSGDLPPKIDQRRLTSAATGTEVGGYPIVKVNGRQWDAVAKPGTILSIQRRWRAGDRVTLELPMPPRISRPIDSVPDYCVIERGPLVLAMTERFNKTGDGWGYASPVLGTNGVLKLDQVALKDPAGQARIGWQMEAMGRFEIREKMITTKFPAILVPFSDAGSQGEPYIAAFPLPGTLDSLPPHLGPSSGSNVAGLSSSATVSSDSQGTKQTSATKAIDGDRTTSWRADSTPYPHWIELNWPQAKTIGRVIVRFGDRRDHPVDFKLMAASAGEAPREILSVKDCKLADYYWARLPSLNAELLRLVIEKSSGDSTAAPINEIEVYE